MTEQSRMVRVTGLPTKIPLERLEDKLCIHFQRGRNGGGEVLSVSTVKTSVDFALITFEDSEVAQRVIQNQHILEVDGERFNLTVKEHPAGPNHDKVIPNLSATVDCSQLSAAKKTLRALCKNHPDVQMNYNSERGFCSLSGSFSTIQAALVQLLGLNEHSQKPPQNKDKPNHSSLLPPTQVLHDQSRAHEDKKVKPLVEEHTLPRDKTPGGYEWEGQGATADPSGLEEDFFLMVDADVFQYLQKYCNDEYHQILKRHGVVGMDYMHQGLTTVLLQVSSGDGQHEQERLRKAREEIRRLCLKNQAIVCRDKLSKAILPDRVGLNQAIDKLSSKFAKLLLSEDEQCIYLIGSKEDVGEAKKFLLSQNSSKDDKVDVTSPRRFQDTWPANEAKAASASPAISDSKALDQVENESRLEEPPRVKIAAQFHKDSRLAPIGSKTSDFTVRGHSQTKNKVRQGPIMGYDVLSDAKGHAQIDAQSTDGDILFKSSGDAMTDTRPNMTTTTPIQTDSLAAPSLPNVTGSSLRRSSSFSGVAQKKEQEISMKSDTESVKGRGRSSSFNSGSKQKQHSAQIIVNKVMWAHIKKAYQLRVAELTSEVQMTEKHLDGNKVSIFLTGTNFAACQEGLQNIIDSVSVDFTIRLLSLSELGVTDATNETLQACCAEINTLYKKISIEFSEKNLYLFGPDVLCSQVSKSLCEVFSNTQPDYSHPSASSRYEGSSYSKINGTNGQVLPRRDVVIREKVKLPSSLEKDGVNVQESITKPGINGCVTLEKTKRQQTAGTGGLDCEACRAGAAVKKRPCGATLCAECLVIMHSQCMVCMSREELKARGIKGKMAYAKLPMSLPGFNSDPAIKITYSIPDGIQGDNHPSPGKPFTGNIFEAYLPDCEQTQRLLPRLQKAFKSGHTFTVNRTGRADWAYIPHKTSLEGAKSASGHPDFTYLNHLSKTLDMFGI